MKWFSNFGFQRRNRELQEEIDAHLQMAIADRVARGETAEAARQAAVREFGNILLVQDVTRQMWGQSWLDKLSRDVRYALRQLRKSPGFTITATAMLAVAICAKSTVFSWIDGTMLRPIPGARDTGDLVTHRWAVAIQPGSICCAPWSYVRQFGPQPAAYSATNQLRHGSL